MNIDRKILYRQNKILIKKYFRDKPAEINELLYLLRKIIFNDQTKDCRIRGQKSDWKGLPRNKSLFFAPSGKGLPIGNLTSQLFGNVYLNNFDHFVKEKLKCHYYGRYVDDMIFMHEDKEYLKSLIPKIKKYLKNNLDLEIHPKKIYLQPYQNGFSFLGAFIKPYRIYPRERVMKNFRQKIKLAAQGKVKNPAFLNSYLGLLKHYSSFNLRRKILTSIKSRKALKILGLEVDENFKKIKQK